MRHDVGQARSGQDAISARGLRGYSHTFSGHRTEVNISHKRRQQSRDKCRVNRQRDGRLTTHGVSGDTHGSQGPGYGSVTGALHGETESLFKGLSHRVVTGTRLVSVGNRRYNCRHDRGALDSRVTNFGGEYVYSTGQSGVIHRQ